MSLLRISENPSFKGRFISPYYNKFVHSKEVKNGCILSTSSFKKVSVGDEYGDIPSYNFSPSNYELLGVTKQLTKQVVTGRSVLDSVEQQLNAINDVIQK